MPAPLLRHNRFATTAANTWQVAMPAVPANRALAVSKVTIANTSASTVVNIFLGIEVATATAPLTGPVNVVGALTLGPGEVYTESGLVLLAGETFWFYTGTVGQPMLHIFGEEVDNV